MRWNIVIWSFILSIALGLPSQESPRKSPRRSCIHMTPEKEQQIDAIVEKLSDFINNLTIVHEHFDIRLIKLAIEQHSAEEVEEKETMLQLSVNDCQLNDDELEEIDHHREKAKQHELERERARAAAEAPEAPDATDPGRKNFDVMFLDLEENGQKLVEALDKQGKGPRLVYVQKDNGYLDYIFFKKRT